MCAGEFSQLSFNALDAGILRERYGYNTTDFAGSSSFPYLPVEGVKDAPFVTKPMSTYSTYVEKTREITQRYLDEIPYLECFSRRQPCDDNDDGIAADLVFMAPYVRLNQLVLPVQESSGSDNATVLLLSGADITASFDNTKGTLVQYSISKLYETGGVAESIKFLPTDARNIMGRFWNDTLGLGLSIGGGGDSELGAILTSVCDGRIYYHMDSLDEERTGPVNIHYFENSVDAVTGDIVTDAQFYAVSGETCPPVERFEDFNITAGLLGENSNDDDYRQEDEINVMLEVTNNGFEDVKYQHLIAGFVVYDSAGVPVAGKLAHFSAGPLPDGKQDFMEFPAGQTVVFGPGGDVGTSGQQTGENLAWETPQPGRYHVKVFVLSPFLRITEFDASVS
jgi:hypothetical protein